MFCSVLAGTGSVHQPLRIQRGAKKLKLLWNTAERIEISTHKMKTQNRHHWKNRNAHISGSVATNIQPQSDKSGQTAK